jgi:phenylpropionate dioxygenase-like ring-hydroxylating dioxygenase large terminal subunit
MQSEKTDSWIPVALSQDLPAATAMPAWTQAGSIALWRSQSGRVAASADRCPHRGMRLSHGFVRGEALSCIYHGWSYSQAGNCLRIPAHPDLTPPDTIRVVTQAVQEHGGVIWVAVGQPAAEPPSLDGLAPLRSLTAQAELATIEDAAGATTDSEGLDWKAPDAPAIRLLLVARDGDETLIHVLVPQGCSSSERIAASRAVEGLRRAAEALQQEGSRHAA